MLLQPNKVVKEIMKCDLKRFILSLLPALKILREKSKEVSGANSNLTAILWTSDLVSKKHLMDYVNKNDYIVQTWTTGK